MVNEIGFQLPLGQLKFKRFYLKKIMSVITVVSNYKKSWYFYEILCQALHIFDCHLIITIAIKYYYIPTSQVRNWGIRG